MEIILYDHIQGRFHVKSRSGRIHYLNLNDKKCTCGKTLIYGFPCGHIIATCQHRCVDFQLFVQGYYTTQSYYDTWASLFYPIFNENEWPLYDGPTIVAPESMKRQVSGCLKSTRLHNEMDVREGKTTIKCGLCKPYRMSPSSLAFVSMAQQSLAPVCSMWRRYVRSCSMSSHPPMISEEPLSPCGGYVPSYPPRHLMQMRSH